MNSGNNIARCLLLVACTALMTQLTQAQTLVSHFEFDGDTTNEVGSAADGIFREGNNATTAVASTPTFGTGVDGTSNGAILFDGVDDWVDATTSAYPNDTGAFFNGAVTMWVKKTDPLPQDDTNTGTVTLMGATDGPAPGSAPFTAFQVQSNAAGSIQTFLRSGDGDVRKFRHQEPSDPGPQFPKTWGDGEWRHVGMVWATDIFGSIFSRVYYDGAPVATIVTNGALTEDFSVLSPWENVMAIGANNQRNVIQTHFDGLIDDLRIYEHSFMDQELDADPFILSVYNEKLQVSPVEGDFSGDGRVDNEDLNLLLGNWGQSTVPPAWVNGFESPVDNDELNALLAGWGTGVEAAIPEPSCLITALLGTVCVASRVPRRA